MKAFVTFACDSDQHLRMVVNMTLCLERNGARAAMDMFHYTMPTDDKIGWIRRMYAEAEVIMVCISPQYLIQADPLMTNVTVNGNGLHTSLIYRMIRREIEVTGTCRRFICVMVGDDTTPEDIPVLLRGCPTFLWPAQYGSVLSYLLMPNTRPQIRFMSESDGLKTYTQL
ncbi:hypothetical protein FSP39_004732 [Pinctada imbricata]|uniref:SEFIR domain-containing protein n=1 Tax=Pinctada imbricata TaxID=66713 RepID=A0AA89C0S5_PINIB|nr:hypothetical protein FSP39_004732 [Pinctada imbricata]